VDVEPRIFFSKVSDKSIEDDVGSIHDVLPDIGSWKYSLPVFESLYAYQVVVEAAIILVFTLIVNINMEFARYIKCTKVRYLSFLP